MTSKLNPESIVNLSNSEIPSERMYQQDKMKHGSHFFENYSLPNQPKGIGIYIVTTNVLNESALFFIRSSLPGFFQRFDQK